MQKRHQLRRNTIRGSKRHENGGRILSAGFPCRQRLLREAAGREGRHAVQEPDAPERSRPRPRSVCPPGGRGGGVHCGGGIGGRRGPRQAEQGGQADAAHTDLLRHAHRTAARQGGHRLPQWQPQRLRHAGGLPTGGAALCQGGGGEVGRGPLWRRLPRHGAGGKLVLRQRLASWRQWRQ